MREREGLGKQHMLLWRHFSAVPTVGGPAALVVPIFFLLVTMLLFAGFIYVVEVRTQVAGDARFAVNPH